MKQPIPVKDKFLLTINEASEYFNIGQKNMRRIAEDHLDSFSLHTSTTHTIFRTKCEKYYTRCLKKEEGGQTM